MAHSLTDLLAAGAGVYEAVKAGEFVAAWDKTILIQQWAVEQARGAGFRGEAPAGADDDGESAAAAREKVVADLKAAKKELGKAPKAKGKAKGAAEPVGKLGDGVLLGKLIDIVLKMLPLFL